MQTKRRSVHRSSGTAAKPYLTKRILKSAVKFGVRKAAAETRDVMGYNVIALNGWVVKKFNDGKIEKIKQIQKAKTTGGLLLD